MKKTIPALFFLIFSGCDGSGKNPAAPVYAPSGRTVGETADNIPDDAVESAATEPKKSEIPTAARVEIIISTEYTEGHVPDETPVIILDKTPRVWIYAFWRGLKINRLYSETIVVCPPDKADVCEDGATLTRKFTPTNTPNLARDAIYIEPLGWMTITGINLQNLKTEEALGNWKISVWPTGQDNPSAEKMLTAM